MKVEYLLYSRTLSNDYRWIFTSALLSVEEIKILKDIFEDFKKIKLYIAVLNYPLFYVSIFKKQRFYLHYSMETIKMNMEDVSIRCRGYA